MGHAMPPSRAIAAVLAVLSGLGPAGALATSPAGAEPPLPMYVIIASPANNTYQQSPEVSTVIFAGGAVPYHIRDDFQGATFVNASHGPTGLSTNATNATNESYYESKAFLHPAGAVYRWIEPVDLVMGGGSG